MVNPKENQPIRHIEWEEIMSCVKYIAKHIPGTIKYVYGIPRNGAIISAMLCHQREDLTFVETYSRPKVKASEMPAELLSFAQSIIIVDDIHDTGRTLNKWSEFVVATLYWREKELNNCPTLWANNITNNDYLVFPWEKYEPIKDTLHPSVERVLQNSESREQVPLEK